MNVEINPSKAAGAVQAPPSKSYGHRLLICAALANGKSVIRNISKSEDMLATIDCIKALGIDCEIDGDCVTVYGGKSSQEFPIYPCRESGSTLRFFIPIALCCTGGGRFQGAERLIQRGIGIYEDLFRPRGVEIEISKDEIKIEGKLESGKYSLMGNVSSQFVSGLLFALPLTGRDCTVEVLPPVESRAYIDITIDAMKAFGVEVNETAPNVFEIKGGQTYKAMDISVEGDWSNAAFLYAFNEVGGNLEIEGLRSDSVQGDKACVGFFEALREPGSVIDISNTPDLGPILFAVAAAKHGGKFIGIRRLRIKESDRAVVMAQELEKFGIESIVDENEMEIIPRKLTRPEKMLDGHNDHRVVMSMAVLASLTGGTIEGAEAVRKSYPDFFEVIEKLGIKLQ